MAEEISKGLKILLILEFIVANIYGITYLFFTEQYIALVAWPFDDPIVGRMLGVSLMTYGLCSLIAFLRKDWKTARIVIELQIFWHILGLGVVIIGSIVLNLIEDMWIFIVILAPFLVAFIYFYIAEQKRFS
ncbi:MAG: hypothetical protein JSV62_01835 [Promethearchaeota archaeon]|nr:MAG: hypothetical protein JSV62_01835 [Candidatus Lokiarchaeota archaeon]